MFFEVWWQDRPGIVGLADADPPEDRLRNLKRHRRHGGIVAGWEPWTYRLLNGDFFDYQPEVFGLRLCSDKLKDVIERNRTPKDVIQWLSVTVVHEDGEARPYWILHFPEPPSVVDETILRGGEAAHRVINLQRATGYNFLPSPDGLTNFLTSVHGRHAIEEADCKGLIFRGYESA